FIKKDEFYFPHFDNARHYRKIIRLTKVVVIDGYGIYFMLIEVLREQQDFRYPISDIDLLADEFGTSLAKVEVVLKKYDLFQLDECNNFFSIKQVYYLQPYLEK
ncbi:MAG: Lin1244/Lin1753 domain-containing protein, partial [bacterium]